MSSAITRRALLGGAIGLVSSTRAEDGWLPLFDGKSLAGWRPSESKNSWKVQDGCLLADGARSHLFYEGPVRNASVKNFEFSCEVMTRPLCNSGIYFHTRYQEANWPAQGFEIQVNNSATGEKGYLERKKTGSLYGVRNVYRAAARDNEWFRVDIAVRGKRVTVKVNDVMLVDYVEHRPPLVTKEDPGRVLGAGTFALQCHDPGSKAMYRNLRVRPLPDNLPEWDGAPPASDDVDRELLRLGAMNVPLVDYHGHLKGITLDQVLAHSRRTGIQYGLALNCGKGFGVENDAAMQPFFDQLAAAPVYKAMQAEGREWVTMFSPAAIARFDYVFTDSMTWTDDDGRRMRTWLPNEVGTIADPQKFMETLVNRACGILEREPVDIYVNPTFIPDAIANRYDELWTRARMTRVVEAAAKRDVAIEINNRYRLPGKAFLRMAKEAGLKFSFGTNNGDAKLGRCEYGIEVVNELGLQWKDFFVPKPDGEKPVQKYGLPS
jgi:hypothetical protein